MRFRHLDAGGLSPSEQRRVLKWAMVFGLIGLAMGGTGIAASTAFRTSWQTDGPGFALVGLVFDTIALLALSQPAERPANWMFALAQISVLVFAALAGLTVISALFGTVADTVRLSWLSGKAKWFGGGHVLILGIGRVAEQIIEDLRPPKGSGKRPRPVVAMELAEDNPRIMSARRRGAIVIEGDATDPFVRKEALLDRAQEIFVVAGDDAVNLDLAGEVLEDLRASDHSRQARPPRIYVHVGEPEFSRDLASREVFGGHHRAVAQVSVFNLWETAARNLITHPSWGLGTGHAPDDAAVPYYVVLGFGEMGRTMALELARLAHFGGLKRPRITICDDFGDPALATTWDVFRTRHPRFSPDMSLADHVRLQDDNKDSWAYSHASVARAGPFSVDYAVHAELLPMPGRSVSESVCASLIERMHDDTTPVQPAIVMCFGDERRNVRSAFELERRMAAAGCDVPVFVYLPRERGLQRILDEQAERGSLLRAFGDLRQTAGYDVVAQPRLKQLAVGAGWAYEVAVSDTMSQEQMAEAVRTPPQDWSDYEHKFESSAPWVRSANLGVAAHTIIKLAHLGYRLQPGQGDGHRLEISEGELEVLARMEHNRWMAQKLLEGLSPGVGSPDGFWDASLTDRAEMLGAMARDSRRATLVPWGEQLDPRDRLKDLVQVQALPAILARAGFELVRPGEVRSRGTGTP